MTFKDFESAVPEELTVFTLVRFGGQTDKASSNGHIAALNSRAFDVDPNVCVNAHYIVDILTWISGWKDRDAYFPILVK